MSRIHPTAIVDPAAQLDGSVEVGAYTLIGPHVKIGAGTVVGPHCVIEGHTSIGESNRFYQFSSIGAANQDMKYAGEPTELVIGDRNTVREFCTLNIGTVQDKGVTRVGHDNWIMAYCHLAHDVVLGNHNVLANGATLAGHVEVGDHVTIGGLTGVLQRMRIGSQAMIGFQAHVAQDVPPFMTVDGNPLTARAVNVVGLKRRGFSDERIATIRQIHKLIYRSGLTLAQAIAEIETLGGEDALLMRDFLAAATRGIVR
ncbi:acyl-ACP--UDP-N-acetylglucosamine O-acyltransferase [Roseateles violae]|uniref:Acyl-[acyl-carrier-protein]--UDP-N-acetylglucosamine O-acyltransferase n=1 Tax=Roseateles violae TaxID=3058042 RepID=A0ABT8DZS0_9BURK|nr:acyl-ACP--UDP-N-acetylglucosamine O-acyltransferase [Pelomonas sp. PFR6]MDN3923053.1 acyl-ACP--UDP-N-acetylglucosamine O-acyltransferase [Pelomonas sp. PFR6]